MSVTLHIIIKKIHLSIILTSIILAFIIIFYKIRKKNFIYINQKSFNKFKF